jgi:hypothetical protein
MKRQQPEIFRGLCDDCGERYEATAKTDNLSGTQFNCKHMFCKGKVTLLKAEAGASNFRIDSSKKIPDRYC